MLDHYSPSTDRHRTRSDRYSEEQCARRNPRTVWRCRSELQNLSHSLARPWLHGYHSPVRQRDLVWSHDRPAWWPLTSPKFAPVDATIFLPAKSNKKHERMFVISLSLALSPRWHRCYATRGPSCSWQMCSRSSCVAPPERSFRDRRRLRTSASRCESCAQTFYGATFLSRILQKKF